VVEGKNYDSSSHSVLNVLQLDLFSFNPHVLMFSLCEELVFCGSVLITQDVDCLKIWYVSLSIQLPEIQNSTEVLFESR